MSTSIFLRKKILAVLLLAIILTFALLQYQNCSPAPNDLLENQSVFNLQSDAEIEEPGHKIKVDPILVGEISFQQPQVSAIANQPLVVEGSCEQNGSLISWKFYDAEDELIERGLASCEEESFEVDLTDLWQDHCGEENLTLEAALGAKSSAEIEVIAPCPQQQ